MITVLGLDHLVLRTAQPEVMTAFYGDILGCKVERRLEDLGLIQMRAGAALIDLVDVAGTLGRKGGAAAGREGRNLDHFCLRVEPEDMKEVAASLAEHGIEAGEPGRRYGAEGWGQSLYFSDPDGNTVELRGPPES
jgi:glyoxylase I family protein